MGNRISGNLAQVKWTVTSGGSAVTGDGGTTLPPALNVAEFLSWSFPVEVDIEDTTRLGDSSPRVDADMRRPGIIECEGYVSSVTGGASPDGAPRLPYVNAADGTRSTAFLRLIVDKTDNSGANNYYEVTAHYIGCITRGRGPGGRKMRTIYRFVPTGAISQVSMGSSVVTIL